MADDFLSLIKSRNFVVKVKIETAGRKGKTVTVLDGLPKQEPFLKGLVSALKKSCGAGGGYSMEGREGIVELQGDHRDRVCKFLEQNEMQFKRS